MNSYLKILCSGFNGEPLGKVLEFIFLEPEDDPRHFCYLTVMAERLAGKQRSPFASLYSLTYVHHDTSPDGVILYEDLQFITLRLEIDFGSIIVSAQLIRSLVMSLLNCVDS